MQPKELYTITYISVYLRSYRIPMNYMSYSKYTSQFSFISSNSLSEVGSFDTDPGYPLTLHISHQWSLPWQSLGKAAATNSCDKHSVVGRCQGALGWWCHIVIWPYIIYILYIYIYMHIYFYIYIYVTPSWKHYKSDQSRSPIFSLN